MNAFLARWANRCALAMRWLIMVAAWIVGTALCAVALGNAGRVVFLPIMMLLPLWLVALLVHEGGHYAAARWAGMTVLRVRVGRMELAPQRRGWRFRYAKRQKLRLGGYVIAVHDPVRPIRRQSICMIAGGPAANLLAAMLASVPGILWQSDVGGALLLAFAVVNAATGLANLVPSSRELESDGLQLWRWRDRQREFGPGFAHARIVARMISGTTADQLPEDQLSVLDSQPTPMPIIAQWYRLKAQQHRGEWSAAADRQLVFDPLEQALSPELQAHLEDFLASIHAELAFCRAMRDRDGRHLSAAPVLEKTVWSLPSLRPRCLALQALLDGNATEGMRLLDEAHRYAGQSLDQSLVLSELLIRGHVLAALQSEKQGLECAFS